MTVSVVGDKLEGDSASKLEGESSLALNCEGDSGLAVNLHGDFWSGSKLAGDSGRVVNLKMLLTVLHGFSVNT